jgi:hypothetical protein
MFMAEKLDSLYRRLDHLERQKVIASDPGILFTIDEQIRECRQEMEEFESGGRRSQGIARSEFSYYLKWLQEFLRVRNGQPVQVPEMEGQEVMALPYVDMEACSCRGVRLGSCGGSLEHLLRCGGDPHP